MGFIYKTSDNNLEKAVPMLLDALSSNDPSVLDGRFYFHLGDALQRVGNKTEVSEVYLCLSDTDGFAINIIYYTEINI